MAVNNVDLNNVPCLVSKDDTALQPHLDLKVYRKKKIIELYGFMDKINIESFDDLINAF